MDRSEKNRDARPAEAENAPRDPEMVKEREMKEDGRYIIFFSFDDEEAGESG